MMRREASLLLLGLSIYKAIRFVSHLLNQPVAIDDSSQDDVILTQTVPLATKYHIFLSFRGEDTRNTFSRDLYEALCNANIHTFMDHKLHKGDDISPILLKIIEESEISLIIFSKDYASSTWCMNELVHIMKCKDLYGRTVIPIFYNVDPSNVRKQNESFGDGFAKLKQRFKHDEERVQEWKNALERSTNLSGWDSRNFRSESQLIKKIVKDVSSKLHNKSSFHLEGLVRIDYCIYEVEELLSESRIVGIWGMGGIGKTTLAKAVFDRLTAQFESFYFAKDVRQQVERNGLDELQEKCLKGLFKDEDINTYNLGSTFVKERLHHKKILLVLDDVDSVIAIEDLIKACGWFGEGSRIIVTSRDEQVLKNTSASRIYHVPQLDPHQAFHLFSLKSFKENEPSNYPMELSDWVVDYCEGNPLALTVVGYLFQGRREAWKGAMEKLNQTIHEKIFDVLKLSFDGLDDAQKNVFVDLAFFLKEPWGIFFEDCRRHLYEFSEHNEIDVLKERSLISVNKYGGIEMNALLMEMGLEISRQQLMSNPEKPIRLRRHQDIYHVFNNKKGIEAIRCMSLDASKIKKTTLRASDFQKMRDLIFLKVYKSDRKEHSKLNICEDLDYVSEELRIFIWEEYPLSYVPLHFCAENIITLKMCNSNIQQLWKGNQHFPNLKEIYLVDSKHLTVLPDLSQAPKIKYLFVNRCVKLTQIHSLTFSGKPVGLYMYGCGPMQIKVGGSIKGRSSRLVIVSGYLDLLNLSFNKVTWKVFVCGNRICGVRFKHKVMPLEDIEELRMGTQSLVSLLPFVRKVEWFERSIEFGHDFNQHHRYCYSEFKMRNDDKEESSHDEEKGDRGEIVNGCQVVLMSLIEDDEEDVLMEHCCSESVRFTRVPNSITRWSLLKELTLKSFPISRPLLDVTLSFPDIIPSSVYPYVGIGYGSQRNFTCGLSGGYPDGMLRASVGLNFGPTHLLVVWDKGRSFPVRYY